MELTFRSVAEFKDYPYRAVLYSLDVLGKVPRTEMTLACKNLAWGRVLKDFCIAQNKAKDASKMSALTWDEAERLVFCPVSESARRNCYP